MIRHRVQVGLANTDDAFVEVTHCQADDTAALAITKRQNTVVCSPPGGNCLRLDRAGAAPAVEALATPYAPGDPPITSLQLDSNRTLLVFNEYDYSLQRPYLKAHLVDLRATPALVRTITLGLSNGVFVSIAGRRVGDDYVLVFDEAATNDGHRVGTATLDFASANLESFATAATLAAPYYSMAVPSGPAPLSMAATNYQGGPCRLDVRRAMDLQLERSFNFGVGNVYFCELVSSNSTHAALLVGSPSAPLSLIDVDILTGQAVAYPAEPRSAGYVYFIEEDPEGDVVLSGTSTDELRGPFAFSIDRNQLFRNGFDD